jgi:hypothetical protein
MDDVASLGTILGVWAHPDDDIFLAAGLMATAVRAGQRVVDVTATRGEGGSMDEERWPPDSMGEVRTKELLRSLEILGVQEHRFLEGPVDVDMESHLDEAGAAQVQAIVEEVQPDTMGDRGVRGGGEAGGAAVLRDPEARVRRGDGSPARAVQHLQTWRAAGHPGGGARDRFHLRR